MTRRLRSSRVSMIELMFALVLLGIVMVGIAVQERTVATAGLFYSQQAQAICVLDNTVERLSTRRDWTPEQIRAVLTDELAATDMPRSDDVTATLVAIAPTDTGGASWQLRLDRADGRTLATVDLPTPETAP